MHMWTFFPPLRSGRFLAGIWIEYFELICKWIFNIIDTAGRQGRHASRLNSESQASKSKWFQWNHRITNNNPVNAKYIEWPDSSFDELYSFFTHMQL